jgi:hypothetical protein
MKSSLIAAFAVFSLFFAACGKKPTETTSSSSSPPLNPRYVAEDPSNDSTASPSSSPSSLADESQQEQATPSPSPSASMGRPVFKSQAATEAANQYLDSYNRVRNDLTGAPGTRPVIPTDPKAAIEAVRSQLQKIGRDTTELANQQEQVNSLLSSDEKKRLKEYQKSQERTTQDPN